MKIKLLAIMLVTTALLSGCENPLKKDEAVVTPVGGGGGGGGTPAVAITLSDIVASADPRDFRGECINMDTATYGSAFNGYSFAQMLTIAGNGAFLLQTHVYSGSTCNLPSVRAVEYTQSGSIALNGLATTPSGATKLTVNQVGNISLKILTSTVSAAAKSIYDAGGCGITFTVNQTENMNLKTCSNGTIFKTQSFGQVGETYFNVVKLDGTTILQAGLPSQFFKLGDLTSAPTTLGYDFGPLF
jgi:hypothetical protein